KCRRHVLPDTRGEYSRVGGDHSTRRPLVDAKLQAAVDVEEDPADVLKTWARIVLGDNHPGTAHRVGVHPSLQTDRRGRLARVVRYFNEVIGAIEAEGLSDLAGGESRAVSEGARLCADGVPDVA